MRSKRKRRGGAFSIRPVVALLRRLAHYLVGGESKVPPGVRRKQGGWLAYRGGGGKRRIALTISTDQSSGYNVLTKAGTPTAPVRVTVTVNSGVYVSSMIFGSFPTGSILRLINHGHIYGSGGAAGSGGGPGGDGLSGGTALTLNANNIYIDNTDGEIFGGGGGGGGGGEYNSGSAAAQGGGGGGGFGYPVGAHGIAGGVGAQGTNGNDGDRTVTNTGGAGGPGGHDGFFNVDGGGGGVGGGAGANGSSGNAGTASGGNGGAAGRAITTNGVTITWANATSHDATHVKGSIV